MPREPYIHAHFTFHSEMSICSVVIAYIDLYLCKFQLKKTCTQCDLNNIQRGEGLVFLCHFRVLLQVASLQVFARVLKPSDIHSNVCTGIHCGTVCDSKYWQGNCKHHRLKAHNCTCLHGTCTYIHTCTCIHNNTLL